MTEKSLGNLLRELADEMRLDGIGFTDAEPVLGDYSRKIHYEGQFVPDERFHSPRLVRPWARSVVAGIISYNTKEREDAESGYGILARYVRGNYYHLLRRKMKRIAERFSAITGVKVSNVYCNGPLDEKYFAFKAGLGFRGKNGLLINKTLGSYVLIALFLTGAELPASQVQDSLCGVCRICKDNCPADCFKGDEPFFRFYRNSCLQELSQRDTVIPDEIKAIWGGRFFGCDECQEKCPFNEKSPVSLHRPFRGILGGKADILCFLENPDEYRKKYFEGSQLNAGWVRIDALIRNALFVLAFQKDDRGTVFAEKYIRSENEGVRDAARFFLNSI